ncbi:MAG: chemotaxis protein CheC [Sarcina sp.]
MGFNDLTYMQIDALKEISNIGAGNATTALSKMLDKTIDMEVPLVKILEVEDIYNQINLEQVVAGVIIEVKGDITGNILFIFKEETAMDIIKRLTGIDDESFDEMGESVICEIGNIISGAYMNAISTFTGLKMIAGIPAIAHDVAGAVVPSMFLALVEDAGKILEIKAVLKSYDKGNLEAAFFYLPTQDSLEKIFNSIGLN